MRPYQGAGAISASGNGSDVIQDGGRKRKLHLHLDGVSKGLSILLPFLYSAENQHRCVRIETYVIFRTCSVHAMIGLNGNPVKLPSIELYYVS